MNTSIKKLDDGRQTESMTSLFLSQSYQDAWDDYARSLKKEGFARWDYIVLTASNEEQAEGFHAQIALRQKEKLLPSQTRFLILPDPDGKRVGSGGATLNVLRAIAEAEGTGDFTGKKILVIHSGGDSKRVPQYSAMGKLFSPVPHELPDGRTSTLFDEFMAEMSGVAGRIREGMVLLSGDVLLLFNSLQIDFPGRGAAAVSFKENVEIGKNHGVFLMGEDGNVAKFLHKQTTESLRAQGAVNEQDSVDIDTGMVIFSPEILNGLYSLISRQGIFDKEKYDTYVNETVRLSLYGDFLYPLAGESTLEAFYEEKPEGEFCPELLSGQKSCLGDPASIQNETSAPFPGKIPSFRNHSGDPEADDTGNPSLQPSGMEKQDQQQRRTESVLRQRWNQSDLPKYLEERKTGACTGQCQTGKRRSIKQHPVHKRRMWRGLLSGGQLCTSRICDRKPCRSLLYRYPRRNRPG